jgi:predicted transcriptional regulator
MGDKMENAEPDPNADFYRRPQAVAKELSYSTDELERRLQLTQSIISNLKYIRAESVGLDELVEKIASVAAAMRLLREVEERNPPAASDARTEKERTS